MTSFLHGIETIEVSNGARPIQTVRSSVIGIVGTADSASADFPLNTPVLVTGPTQAAGLGVDSTLLEPTRPPISRAPGSPWWCASPRARTRRRR
ncbi:MAG: hypothetical protein AAF192_20145 [Pseudomonadota bacterium]